MSDEPAAAAPHARAATSDGERARHATARTATRIWLRPFLFLFAGAFAVLALGEVVDGGRGMLTALRDPDAVVSVAALGNAAQIVAQVLGVAISVVAIIVELAANRYTHRITELFFRAPANFLVMGFFVIAALEPMWVSFTYTGSHAPRFATGLSMVLMSAAVLMLIPYFAYVAAFVNPLNVIYKIRRATLGTVARGPATDKPEDVERVQHAAAEGAEQLTDVALNAMANHDKAISMSAIHALGDLMRDYLALKPRLSRAWFGLGEEVRSNPDFVSLADEALGEIANDRTWFEFKLLRQYEMIYRAALNTNRELNYLVATNVRELAEGAMERGDKKVVDLAIKFFNTFLRATVNGRDIRTAYNVLNQYRLIAETALRRREGRIAVAIAKYFKYYGQIAFHMDLGFILETAAYDLCGLNELAFDLGSNVRAEMLRVFLQVDKEGEGAKKEAALRGVRKAQVKLATYYMVRGDDAAAREVYRDMANENPDRLASIRDELLAVDSPYFWEVTDRGTNFDWMPPDRREKLMAFFEWFGETLPAPRASVVPSSAVGPVPISASATNSMPALSADDAAAVVSDPGGALVSAPPTSGEVAVATPVPSREDVRE